MVTRPSSSRTNEPPRKIQLFLNKTPEMYIHAGATIVVTVIIKISTMHFQLNLNYYQYLTMLLLWSKRERRGQSSESELWFFFFFYSTPFSSSFQCHRRHSLYSMCSQQHTYTVHANIHVVIGTSTAAGVHIQP